MENQIFLNMILQLMFFKQILNVNRKNSISESFYLKGSKNVLGKKFLRAGVGW